MRILFWSERFWPTIGGVGISASKLLPALQARGYEILVVTSNDYFDLPEEDYFKEIPVYRFRFWSSLAKGNMNQVMELRRRIAHLKQTFLPDLVHIGFLGASVVFHLHTFDAHTSPLLVSTDSSFPDQELGRNSLTGRTLRMADWVTCVSAARLAEARKLMPEIINRSSFIYNGRETPACSPEPLSFEVPRLLCLGRLDPIKGFDIALSAFVSVLQCFPKARLLIAGDGSERAQLERQAVRLGIEANVEFVGWVRPDDVPALINSATIVVIPSRNEGLPNVAKEAALLARPIVATNVGGIPEAVMHGETGLIIGKEDSRALATAINRLLEDPEAAAAMGRAGRLHAQQLFSLESYIDAYDTLYGRLINKCETRGLRPIRAN
jgi:glycogen(starch) synthase